MGTKQTVGIEIDVKAATAKAIDRAADAIVERVSGEDFSALDSVLKKAIDEAIDGYCKKNILPRVEQQIREVVLIETNKWGEKVGKPLTFTEYLVSRAEHYITEQVDFNGKTRAEDSYNWRGTQTRIVYLIEKHLHYEIERAMKAALQTANNAIAGGITEAVKIKLGEVVQSLQVNVKVKG